MTTRLRPLGDQVVVRPAKSEEITQGGIVLPERARQQTFRGEVLAVGPGKFIDLDFDEKEEEEPISTSQSGSKFIGSATIISRNRTKPLHQPMSVKVGDVVLYAAYAGQKIEQDGEELLLLKEEQLLAVVNPDPFADL